MSDFLLRQVCTNEIITVILSELLLTALKQLPLILALCWYNFYDDTIFSHNIFGNGAPLLLIYYLISCSLSAISNSDQNQGIQWPEQRYSSAAHRPRTVNLSCILEKNSRGWISEYFWRSVFSLPVPLFSLCKEDELYS